MPRTIRDAAGRTVVIGDTVGGTTAQPRPVTVTGEVIEIDHSGVLLTVATASASGRAVPAADATVWLPARQMFLVHARAPQAQQARPRPGRVISMRWSGKIGDLPLAARFAGTDLIGALEGTGGWTLLLSLAKDKAHPDLVLPGWWILRPPRRARHRACDPVQYAANYAPAAPDSAAGLV